MSRKVKTSGLADAVMEELNAYAKTTTEGMNQAVTKAATTTKKEIKAHAPKKHGDYQKSWTQKKTSESSHALQVTVYSRNRYQLAHLLEHGHAKRNGGRTRAIPHIAPAETIGEEQLMKEIERMIKDG